MRIQPSWLALQDVSGLLRVCPMRLYTRSLRSEFGPRTPNFAVPQREAIDSNHNYGHFVSTIRGCIMKLSEGVEQAFHCTAFLAGLSEHGVLSAAALAELHGVSTSYLLKRLQALSGAGSSGRHWGRKAAIVLPKHRGTLACSTSFLRSKDPRPPFAVRGSASEDRIPCRGATLPGPARSTSPC